MNTWVPEAFGMPRLRTCPLCNGHRVDLVTDVCYDCAPRMASALREIAERGCYADRQIAKKALGMLPEAGN